MAESIYTQLENQAILTPVNGVEIRHNLPEGLFPDDKTFENENDLILWANENNYTAKLIQKGLQKGVIEVRACYKSCPKDKTWTEELGQKNLDAMKWELVNRPKTTKSQEDIAREALSGMSPEKLAEFLKSLNK